MIHKTKNQELGRSTIAEFQEQKKHQISIILDNVRSLHNVGSFFRTADAFNIAHIYLVGITGVPPNKEIYKTALGSTDSMSWSYHPNILDPIEIEKKKNSIIFGVEQTSNSISLEQIKLNSNTSYVLIFGNEVSGVSQEALDLCDDVIEIPQWGTKHSLNVSVSGGVVLWEFVKQISKKQ